MNAAEGDLRIHKDISRATSCGRANCGLYHRRHIELVGESKNKGPGVFSRSGKRKDKKGVEPILVY
jgi:hypothetical protein